MCRCQTTIHARWLSRQQAPHQKRSMRSAATAPCEGRRGVVERRGVCHRVSVTPAFPSEGVPKKMHGLRSGRSSAACLI